MEIFLAGILVGFVLGCGVIGFLWDESIKDENDQLKKK